MSLDWFYTAIAWVMKEWHTLFSTFLDPAGGITWALSIAFLVVTVRIVLFRFFIKQVKSQRAMQELQPEIQKLKKQYGADRQGFSQAVMTLQKERGVNPLAGCLPIVPQIPIFIALLHVLRRLAPGKPGLYSWSDELTHQAATAQLFGAPISSSFRMTGAKADAILAIPGVSYTNIRIVALVLMVVMCVTTYTTQRQIMRKSGPVEGQAAMVQKFMLYGMPLSLFASGFLFPIGVLLYWFTNNLWTLGQQFYILKKLPPPGSPVAKGKAEAATLAVDPKSLAPRPGAKPVRDRSGRPLPPAAPTQAGAADADGAGRNGATAVGGVAGSATPSAAARKGHGATAKGPDRTAKGSGATAKGPDRTAGASAAEEERPDGRDSAAATAANRPDGAGPPSRAMGQGAVGGDAVLDGSAVVEGSADGVPGERRPVDGSSTAAADPNSAGVPAVGGGASARGAGRPGGRGARGNRPAVTGSGAVRAGRGQNNRPKRKRR